MSHLKGILNAWYPPTKANLSVFFQTFEVHQEQTMQILSSVRASFLLTISGSNEFLCLNQTKTTS